MKTTYRVSGPTFAGLVTIKDGKVVGAALPLLKYQGQDGELVLEALRKEYEVEEVTPPAS